MVSQSQWSQDPNSTFQASYAEVIQGAENFLSQQTLSKTDGKRILAYNTERPHQERDEESVQLLKKITDMEIDDYPLMMEIKDTWESWNSPAPSPDSLLLDEIEEMNLTNIQEG
ncbi:hypothetical protein J1N35_025814 [Gossypium stocksii]|uniref:Uncharacterized protein n=1 Tax=Gossypium stocksii TaxID=47602 RepID=A0A9D3ZY21_9ROSI|nr:hypothetical protein J1N35_025814 [Gossypium stocksii]